MPRPWKPTREQILAAEGKTVRDVIAPNLKVLFCGINPGLYTAAVGHHFARPGNRFWPTLHASNFTHRRLSAFEERELLKYGYGVTNIVRRATSTAEGLERGELVAGGRKLVAKVRRYKPQFLSILGLGAYRIAFDDRKAVVGRQEKKINNTVVWVLPNPSGLNAHYQFAELVSLFRDLKSHVDRKR